MSSEKSSTIGAKLLGVIKSTAIDCWSVQQHPKLQSQLCKTGNHGSINYHTQSTSWDTCLLKLLGAIRSFLRAGKIRSEGSRFLCHHFATWNFSKWILRESRRVNKVKNRVYNPKAVSQNYFEILLYFNFWVCEHNQSKSAIQMNTSSSPVYYFGLSQNNFLNFDVTDHWEWEI